MSVGARNSYKVRESLVDDHAARVGGDFDLHHWTDVGNGKQRAANEIVVGVFSSFVRFTRVQAVRPARLDVESSAVPVITCRVRASRDVPSRHIALMTAVSAADESAVGVTYCGSPLGPGPGVLTGRLAVANGRRSRTSLPASVALLAGRRVLQKQGEKVLSVVGHLLKSGFVAARDQCPFCGRGLAPRAEEVACDGLGCGPGAGGVGAQDRVAQLVAGVAHDQVEHGPEVRQLFRCGRRFGASSAADSGCGECTGRVSRVPQQHLLGIRFKFIGLVHIDRLADLGSRDLVSERSVRNSECSPAAWGKSWNRTRMKSAS